jgi:hypothetical protein
MLIKGFAEPRCRSTGRRAPVGGQLQSDGVGCLHAKDQRHPGLGTVLRCRAISARRDHPVVDHAPGNFDRRSSASSSRAIGILLIVGGVPGLVDSFARFALQGLGTPAPVAPPQYLVVAGLYRYVRNPMYVSVLAVICGQAWVEFWL